MKVLGTGLSGLVGTRIADLLSSSFEFSDLSKTTGVDITDYRLLQEKISQSDAPWIFHFAAYTDVQGAEKERELGEKSIAWNVNVIATGYIADIAKATDKRVLYLSTDYVFDGTKPSPYSEDDRPNPVGWYATTKYEGEKRIMALGESGCVIRISNPYRSFPVGKKDWVHKIVERLEGGLPVASPIDSLFCPTHIDDLAGAIAAIVKSNSHGIFHVVSREGLTPFDASGSIAKQWNFPLDRIGKTVYDQFYAGRAKVPKNGVLSHSRIDALGVCLHSFQEGIYSVYNQEHEPVS